MHLQVASDVAGQGLEGSTLEIGAGTLNHLAYEPNTAPYDVIEPFTELYEDNSLTRRIRNFYGDIAQVPSVSRYRRVISIATLEHILDLPGVVAAAALLLEEGGQFRAAIPSEGSLLWGLGWKLTTGLEFRLRHRLDYGVLLRHEHVNTAEEIEAVLRFFFERVESTYFGLNKALSFYQCFFCSGVRGERCAGQLAAQ